MRIKVKDLEVKLKELKDKEEIVYIRTKIETSSNAGVTNITTELCVEHFTKHNDLEIITLFSETY